MKPISLFRQEFTQANLLRNGARVLRRKAADEKPLRAQIFTREALERHAEELARTQRVYISRAGEKKVYQRFEENAATIERAYFQFSEYAREKESLTPGVEWLLDNYHVVEEQVRDIREHFPRGYYRTLPKLREGDLKDLPRVYELALHYIQHTDAVVTGDLLECFVRAYQNAEVLTIGELWAVPIMLRLALVENLRRLAKSGLRTRARRNLAQQILHRVFEEQSLSGTDRLLSLADALKTEPDLLPWEAAYLIRPLRAQGKAADLALHWLEERVREQGYDPDDLVRLEQQSQAANQISTGNTVTSLKAVGSLDWKQWFEGVSRVDAVLRHDPAAHYSRCDFRTRDTYRQMVEGISRQSEHDEVQVAQAAIDLAEKKKALIDTDSDSHGTAAASHVGYYLIDEGRLELEQTVQAHISSRQRLRRWSKRHSFELYLLSIVAVWAGLLLFIFTQIAFAPAFQQAMFMLLFAVPASVLSIHFVQWIATHLAHPFHLPKLGFEKGLPAEGKTVVVVHAIFNDREAIRKAVEMLEVRFLGNEDEHLTFALLADLHDAEQETLESDAGLIEFACESITALNQRYGSEGNETFAVLFRHRQWSSSERKWIAWERKRGKLEEFNQFLLGDDGTSFSVVHGDRERLRGAHYVITLDSDTQLPGGTARRLVGAIAHILNQPVFDESRRVVTRGYGVIQPRAAVSLSSAQASWFSRVFSGPAGIDPYTEVVSDVYQDLFHEGSYIGKGIYNIRAFEHALRDRVPENALLSHDLFEGLFARVALATDIELPDDFPTRYNVFARRQHRWVRGDWQLLPWIWRRVPDKDRKKYPTPVDALGRWKLFDNLRRSLLAPTLFFFLAFVWVAIPSMSSLALTLSFLVFAFPFLAGLVSSVLISPFGISLGVYVGGVSKDLGKSLAEACLRFIFLPYKAGLMLDAVLRTVFRLAVTHRKLLEWETAYSAERRMKGTFVGFCLEMWPGLVMTVLLGALLFLRDQTVLLNAAPVLALWVFSPLVATLISRPVKTREHRLSASEREYLQDIAWETWSYFDTFLTPEFQYLACDNIQLVPDRIVAERTSPTNIGLSLLSTVSAYDLGFACCASTVERLDGIMTSLASLERFHGHFFNWYHTRSAEPLSPRYVSTVDSGNLAGHLLAVRSALEELYYGALFHDSYWSYLRRRIEEVKGELGTDTIEALDNALNDLTEGLNDVSSNFYDVYRALQCLKQFLVFLESSALAQELLLSEDSWIAKRFLSEIEIACSSLNLFQWIESFGELPSTANTDDGDLDRKVSGIKRILESRVPSLSLLSRIHGRLLGFSEEYLASVVDQKQGDEQADSFLGFLERSVREVQRITDKLRDVDGIISRLYREMDFQFLYDSEKNLFVIGYNVETGRRDESYYDLLASEARLVSLLAIAKGEIPQKHWFSLGRSLTDTGTGKALMSWSGTMFEYLMPLLVNWDYPGTLLSESYRAVVRAQQRYGRKRRVPWGISESGYSGVNFEETYQYRAFGVPGLGLKRGLSNDLVVSPYSTFLALQIDPPAAMKNLKVLEEYNMRGEYGFYEAVDFTAERLSSDEEYHVVQSFLAHHQGMSLVAVTNFLKGGIFPARLHKRPAIRAVERLLHERFPLRVPTIVPHQAELARIGLEEDERIPKGEVLYTPHTVCNRTRLLSNGSYSVMVDNAGSGFSRLDSKTAITRWREDACRNDYGFYIFVRDVESGELWSTTYQPTRVEPNAYEVIFGADKAEFRRRDHGIGLHTEVVISPEHNVEIRRVTVTNFSTKKRSIELTSFAEVVLGSEAADLAHPAFSKMFIESEFVEDFDTLLFSRRPRSVHEERLFLFHMVVMRICWQKTQFESSREKFLGRGRDIHAPRAFGDSVELSGSTGFVLDPVCSLRTRIEVEPGESESVSFIVGTGTDREEALDLASHYHELSSITRAYELAWSQTNVELRHELFTSRQAQAFQRLANAMFFPIPALRGDKVRLLQNRLTQQGLWRFGVSGDYPIVLLTLSDPQQTPILQEALLAHEYLRLRGMQFDLIVLNEHAGGYFQNFQEEIESIIRHSFSGKLLDRDGGVFIRTVGQLSSEEVSLLHAVARVVLRGVRGTLHQQLELRGEQLPVIRSSTGMFSYLEQKPPPYQPAEQSLRFFNGFGGFSESGDEYCMHIRDNELPPQPWSNVIANDEFGFLVTESGGGYTWSGNSRENRLTPWSNDPVSDQLGEVIYIRDTDSGRYWCPTPLPVRNGETFAVSHQFGVTDFRTQIYDIFSECTLFGSPTDRAKWYSLKLVNGDFEPRTLDIYFCVEWVLGVQRSPGYRQHITEFRKDLNTLSAVNHYNNEFAGRFSFIGSSDEIKDFTSDRLEFIGRNRTLESPYVLEKAITKSLATLVRGREERKVLSEKQGSGFDSCGVLRVAVTLEPGEEREVLFYLAEALNTEEMKERAKDFASKTYAHHQRKESKRFWQTSIRSLTVKTPDESLDVMVNGWLLYQTLSCRMFGRSGFFQSGGAFGFRDQLQDVMSLLYTRPDLARKQIILHASRQFVDGDVQHWWHPPTGRGVRTRISDDYLWLPFTVARYLEVTGDRSLLDEVVNYIEGEQLEPGQMEAYMVPRESSHRGTLYDHCVIAIDRALRFGEHGLPLIGGGDWNDGMNEVGMEGKGESVWLGWFLVTILGEFERIVRERNDLYRAREYETRREELRRSIESNAWDGAWYRRGYYDDGRPLGSAENDECKIDSLSQSWSIISGAGDPQRSDEAMENVYRLLVDQNDNIIRLLFPPFDRGQQNPGYIKGYLPGIRENGGQYTHAASWVILATAMRGFGGKAHELFSMINPVNHTSSAEKVMKYHGEPYVTCGDVYSVAPHVGKAGWSWYTGSAGWLYRVAVEKLLGFEIRGREFTLRPCIPPEWPEYEMTYHRDGTTFLIKVENPEGISTGTAQIWVNGQKHDGEWIHFPTATEDSECHVRLVLRRGEKTVESSEPNVNGYVLRKQD